MKIIASMVHERIQNKRSLLKLIEKRLGNYEVAKSRIKQIQVTREKDHASLPNWCFFYVEVE